VRKTLPLICTGLFVVGLMSVWATEFDFAAPAHNGDRHKKTARPKSQAEHAKPSVAQPAATALPGFGASGVALALLSSRSQEQYDAIISVHTISNAAAASGALAPAENYAPTRIASGRSFCAATSFSL
jgi:hypothetical protein